MAPRVLGDERRGQDDDDGPPAANERKVDIENAYFEKLKGRLNTGGGSGNAPATAEHADARDSAPEKPKGPGFVIYGDDGRPID